MAEFVEKRLEETIPETEELERIRILSPKEVKKLIQKRRELQYHLVRCSKKKNDFIEAIKYEQKLIELIRIRRKLMGIQEKKYHIEARIARRVIKLARFLTRTWPYHNDTWDLRISFARFVGWKEEIASAFTEQVGYQGNRESVWISWAKWEVEDRKNFDRARIILLSKAALYHPKSILIKRELFRLELLYVEHLKMKMKNDNIAALEEIIAENREKVLNCAAAQAVYCDAVTTMPDPELYLQLYQVAHKFEFAHRLRDQIYRDLIIKFPNAECVWKLKAQRLAEGIQVENDCEFDVDVMEESEDDILEDEDNNTVTPNKQLVRLLEAKDIEETNDCSTSEESESEDENENQETIGDRNLEALKNDDDEEEDENSDDDDEEEVDSDDEGEEESENDEVEAAQVIYKELRKMGVSGIKIEKEEDISEDDLDEALKVDGKKTVGVSEVKVEKVEGVFEDSFVDEELEDDGKQTADELKIEDEESEKHQLSSVIKDLDSDFSGGLENECTIKMTENSNVIDNDVEIKPECEKTGEKEGTSTQEKSIASPGGELQEWIPKHPVHRSPREKLKLIISTFDAAIVALGASFACTYVEELLSLLHQCWGVTDMNKIVMKTLRQTCQHHVHVLAPRHFYIWFLVLREQSAARKKLQVVLNKGLHQHPKVMPLELARVRFILSAASSDEVLLKEFDKVGHILTGGHGLEAWLEVVQQLKDESLKMRVLEQAANHNDPVVARGTRALYLKQVVHLKGVKRAREVYKKLSWCPFSGQIHSQMVELELSETEVNVAAVRKIFHNAVQQHGSNSPGMWLAYIWFEKQRGDPLKTGALYKRAEKELKATHAHTFRQLDLNIQDIHSKEPIVQSHSLEETDDGSILIDVLPEELEEENTCVVGPRLVELFPEEPTLTYTANNARIAFFSAIAAFDTQMTKVKKSAPKKDDGSEWEGVLEKLLGQRVQLNFTTLSPKGLPSYQHQEVSSQQKPAKTQMVAPRFSKRDEPTDHLDPGTSTVVLGARNKTKEDDEVRKALESSAILQPEFLQKTRVPPLFVSKKKAKAKRKREAEKTKGPGWFNMKAPEITEEVKRDLEVLKMRSVLDPRRHFKASDMKVTPKYFQLGTVVDSPVDFYSSRIPKKQRKRTMAEEIMHDEEALRYQKRKYTQIIAAKQKQIRHPKKGRKGNKKSKVQ